MTVSLMVSMELEELRRQSRVYVHKIMAGMEDEIYSQLKEIVTPEFVENEIRKQLVEVVEEELGRQMKIYVSAVCKSVHLDEKFWNSMGKDKNFVLDALRSALSEIE